MSSDQLILVKANCTTVSLTELISTKKLSITRNIDLLHVDFCKAFDKVPHK